MRLIFGILVIFSTVFFASCKNDASDTSEAQGVAADSLTVGAESQKREIIPPTSEELGVSTSLMRNLMVEDSLSTLSRLVVTATMAQQLMAPTQEYTFFAPINTAFEKVEQDSLQKLVLAQNRSLLKALIGTHMVLGKFDAAALAERYRTGDRNFQTVAGNQLRLGKRNGVFGLTDENGRTAYIVRGDINASNGMLHLVDGVLGLAK